MLVLEVLVFLESARSLVLDSLCTNVWELCVEMCGTPTIPVCSFVWDPHDSGVFICVGPSEKTCAESRVPCDSGAAILTSIYALLIKTKGKQTGFLWFFLIVLLATWSGGIWIQPISNTSVEIRWWPFIIIGLPFAILIAVFGPRKRPKGRQETLAKLEEIADEKTLEHLTWAILKVVFWFIVAVMAVAILVRHITPI